MNTSAHVSLWQRFCRRCAQPWLLWAFNQGCQYERRRAQAYTLATRQVLPMTPISVPVVQQPEPTTTSGFNLARRQQDIAKKNGVTLPPPKTKPAPGPAPRLPEKQRREILRNVFSDIETIPAPQDIDPALVTIGDIPLSEPAQHNPLALTGLAADLFGTENDAWLSSTEREPTHALDELADLATMRHNSDTLEVPTYMRKKRAKSEESE